MKYTFTEAMKQVLSEEGMGQGELSARLGLSKQAAGNAINKGNPSIRIALRYLSEVHHGLAIVPEGVELPEGCYELTTGEARKRGNRPVTRDEFALFMARSGYLEATVGGERAYVPYSSLDVEGADTDCTLFHGDTHMVPAASVRYAKDMEGHVRG